MECKNEQCSNEVTGRSQTCSDKCRKAVSRQSVTKDCDKQSVTSYVRVPGAKCYGRQAVKCNEFSTRPEPLDHTHQPFPLNRGRYTRKDGTVYMFDAIGQSFDCVDGEVYPTVAVVRQAAAERVGAA